MRTIEVTRSQLRAGRALTRLPQRVIAHRAGISENTYSGLESGKGEYVNAHASTLRRVIDVLEASGVQFISGGGVRDARSEWTAAKAETLAAEAVATA